MRMLDDLLYCLYWNWNRFFNYSLCRFECRNFLKVLFTVFDEFLRTDEQNVDRGNKSLKDFTLWYKREPRWQHHDLREANSVFPMGRIDILLVRISAVVRSARRAGETVTGRFSSHFKEHLQTATVRTNYRW